MRGAALGNLLGGDEGCGLQQVLSALEIGRINIAARAVGVAQARLRRGAALRAGSGRRSGSPIGEFQAIQLKIADMATKIQAARLLTYWAADRRRSAARAAAPTWSRAWPRFTRPRWPSSARSARCRSTAPTVIHASSWSSGYTATRR